MTLSLATARASVLDYRFQCFQGLQKIKTDSKRAIDKHSVTHMFSFTNGSAWEVQVQFISIRILLHP